VIPIVPDEPAAPPDARDSLERRLLVHLLTFRSHQVRFEADPAVTEFGILRAFAAEGAPTVRVALRALENARLVYTRVQYVVGFSEPKVVYSLTDTGIRRAHELLAPPVPEESPESTPSSTPSKSRFLPMGGDAGA
jgi:DNA-binding transcriptional ArsR family regulator